MVTYTLLIIYTDGTEHKVKYVNDYGYKGDFYYFTKNSYNGFLPKENIKFIGREFDYYNKGAETNEK